MITTYVNNDKRYYPKDRSKVLHEASYGGLTVV
jgi:hypothetical protein